MTRTKHKKTKEKHRPRQQTPTLQTDVHANLDKRQSVGRESIVTAVDWFPCLLHFLKQVEPLSFSIYFLAATVI